MGRLPSVYELLVWVSLIYVASSPTGKSRVCWLRSVTPAVRVQTVGYSAGSSFGTLRDQRLFHFLQSVSPVTPMDEDNPFVTDVRRSNEARHDEDERTPEYDDSSDCSDSSSETPLEVDAIVREDMGRLEQIFDNMGFKFRMIDRIGEGQ